MVLAYHFVWLHKSQVCGVREKRADNVWLAAEGVYLPVTETK